MLSVRDRGIALSIIRHCQRIVAKTADVSLETFKQDEDLREIVCFNLLQIGELAKNFSENFFKDYPKMPWKQIKGMRDKVAHGYGALELDLVYFTANEDVPTLLDYCSAIINEN